jgi:hypothetical protein
MAGDIKVQTSKPEELYDELVKRIHAEDGSGAREIYRQLLDAGRPRQEIVSEISRCIEKQSPDKTQANVLHEIRWPKPQSLEPSQTEAHQKANTWPDTPIRAAADRRLDVRAERTLLSTDILRAEPDTAHRAGAACELGPEPQKIPVSGHRKKPLISRKGPGDGENAIQSFEEHRGTLSGNIMPQQIGGSSEFIDLNVPERLSSELRLQRDLPEAEARQTAPAEAVPVTDRPSPAQRESTGWSRGAGIILTGTSVFAVVIAAFLLWGLYGQEIEEVSVVNAHPAQSWLHRARVMNVSSNVDAETPTEKAGAQQVAAVHESDIAKASTTAAATQNDDAGRTEGRIEPDTGATSTRATAEVTKNTPVPVEGSQTAEGEVFAASTSSRSQQNEEDARQAAQTAGPPLPPIDTGVLLARGDQSLSSSDIASARIYYARAAMAGDGRGALRMGMTFDPVFLARLRLRGIQADAAQATAWYRRASALGNSEGELLQRELSSLSRGVGSGSGSMRGVAGQHRHQPRVAARSQRTRYAPHRARGTAR